MGRRRRADLMGPEEALQLVRIDVHSRLDQLLMQALAPELRVLSMKGEDLTFFFRVDGLKAIVSTERKHYDWLRRSLKAL